MARHHNPAPAWDVLFAEASEAQAACLGSHDAAAAGLVNGGKRKKGGGFKGDSEGEDVAAALGKRMSAAVYPVEAGTEQWMRLGLLLRSIAASPAAGRAWQTLLATSKDVIYFLTNGHETPWRFTWLHRRATNSLRSRMSLTHTSS
jgi:hypothetical protein